LFGLGGWTELFFVKCQKYIQDIVKVHVLV